ncbi:acyl-CoA carboxylase subunit beta [Cellulosilyticum sp. I15G10I2]|uniref:acyl-CoA carboxylase subunit beta n=1 Tax=Cellulosilyticum sp. I15G10I2 TaxID=1892843 RepID=UPI00085BD088|nr:carboxyl transferase domain-containing protein [Cellulosilyticum sp. I15G10I2]
MSTLEKLSELESRRAAIENSGNEDAKKVSLAKGKLSARDRITNLLDENSFVEIGAFIRSKSTAFNMGVLDTPADGLVSGYGTINGNPVYVYSQDANVLGGAIGEMHAKKIVRIYNDALKMGVPVIGILDTVGIRLQESIDALEGYGSIFMQMTNASGVIPQIAIVCGDCAGGAAFIAGLSDFVFMPAKTARMFLNSPNTIDDKSADFDHIATAKVHFEESGLASFIADQETDVIREVRNLITYLPQSNSEDVPFYNVTDDINRMDANLNQFDFSANQVKDIVASIVDNGEYLELNSKYGADALTAFARMNGGTVGVIANITSTVDYHAVKKMTKFVSLCDGFNIPVVTLTQATRFTSTLLTEKLGIIKECSKLVHAFANATVPKINVILNEAFGSSYIAMNSKHIGADYVYAWPTAKVSTLNAESAVKIIYDDEIKNASVASEVLSQKIAEYEHLNSSAYAVAARGYIDDIIEPAATRKRVIAALEILSTKQVDTLYKKHPTV